MRKLSFLLIPIATLAACGGDDGGVTPLDGPAGGIDAPVTCSVSTGSFGNKGALTGGATFAASMTNAALYRIAMQAPLEAAMPFDVLFVDFFTGYTPFGTETAPTPVVPGTYQLTGEQLNYETCGVCVTLGTNATATEYEDDYMVTGGTLVVAAVGDAVGETLTLTVSNLEFEHVTIDGTTSVSTPVGDGCGTTLTNATFTGMVAAPPPAVTGAGLPRRSRRR